MSLKHYDTVVSKVNKKSSDTEFEVIDGVSLPSGLVVHTR